MRPEVLRVLEFAQRADSITHLEPLTEEVAKVLHTFGVTSVSANLIVTPGRVVQPGMLIGRAWREWSHRYARLSYQRFDPAVRMLRDQTRPFTWTQARTRYPSFEGEDVMNACRDYTGCAEGFVVPVRESDGALLSAAFCGPTLDLEHDARQAFHLAGYYYATRGREILSRIELDPVCPLTPRQLECLRWVQAGKTDAEIGILLGLSSFTVHNHVEAAKRVLNVSKRSQAAFEAWRKGWFA